MNLNPQSPATIKLATRANHIQQPLTMDIIRSYEEGMGPHCILMVKLSLGDTTDIAILTSTPLTPLMASLTLDHHVYRSYDATAATVAFLNRLLSSPYLLPEEERVLYILHNLKPRAVARHFLECIQAGMMKYGPGHLAMPEQSPLRRLYHNRLVLSADYFAESWPYRLFYKNGLLTFLYDPDFSASTALIVDVDTMKTSTDAETEVTGMIMTNASARKIYRVLESRRGLTKRMTISEMLNTYIPSKQGTLRQLLKPMLFRTLRDDMRVLDPLINSMANSNNPELHRAVTFLQALEEHLLVYELLSD